MYEAYLEKSAERDFKRIPSAVKKSIIDNIKSLSDNPRPSNCKKLKGVSNIWRVRVGYYRIIYDIIDSSKRINIYKIKHRRDVYEK